MHVPDGDLYLIYRLIHCECMLMKHATRNIDSVPKMTSSCHLTRIVHVSVVLPFALLLPSRAELSSFAEHLQALGMSDHLVSGAFYLEDFDGLTIELYADRNPEEWEWYASEIAVTTQPLNLRKLLKLQHQLWAGVPNGSTMGHIHLHVGDLHRAEELYRQGLGINVRSRGLSRALSLRQAIVPTTPV